MTDSVSLTELRQRLFQLADQVAETGTPLVIMRNGVRLRLVRDETVPIEGGRLARLVKRSVVIGAPLDPRESPAKWSGDALKVAEQAVTYAAGKPRRGRRRS